MKKNRSSSSTRPSSISSCLIYEESETRNRLELPRDITATILLKVGPIDILNNAQRVCTLWRSISKDPAMWCVIDMVMTKSMDFDFETMCYHAIDRSQGKLVAISLSNYCSDHLLYHIADSASHLQRLCLVRFYDLSNEGMREAVEKMSCLEELELTIGHLSEYSLEAIGRCCPLLKSLKFNMQIYGFGDYDAFAVAKTMPNLQHLQLVSNRLTNEGLLAILDGCPLLESLDLRKCFNVDLGGSLGRRCAEQIKHLLKPGDPYDDYPSFNYDKFWEPDVYQSYEDEFNSADC